jgi:hypothetical protein
MLLLCRAFKPEYDKVARFLSSQPAGANRVVALRLDCAVDVSNIFLHAFVVFRKYIQASQGDGLVRLCMTTVQ